MSLYVHTLAPSILPADSGEFQLVAQVLGIAHPPGYPPDLLLGKLATLIPLRDAAYRVNLLSAIIAALAVALTNRLVRRMTGSMLIGFAVKPGPGGSAHILGPGTTANIRSLTPPLYHCSDL